MARKYQHTQHMLEEIKARPKAKCAVIYRHKEEYPVSVMCRIFGVSRSGYYDFVRRIAKPERDEHLAEAIRQQQNYKWVTDISYIHTEQGVPAGLHSNGPNRWVK